MIGYSEALQIVLQNAGTPRTETLPLMHALGRIAAAKVKSAVDVPSFRNSAMDGFAVRLADIAAATAEHPVTLPVARALAAGDSGAFHSDDACAVSIMTGAVVPEPFEAVIPVEEATTADGAASFMRAAKPGENIRLPGEDVRLGQTVIRYGDMLTPERIMLLAALGVAEVEAQARPALHILSTGKEITDERTVPLPGGKIHNSNAPYLLARCREEGLTAHYGGIIADDPTAFGQRLHDIPAGSVIITTGAVSKGTWDFIPESLKKLGAKTHFHRVNIRPGKPVLFATLPNGNRFFGLPGNPISAAVGFRFFVLPLMRALQGLAPEQSIMARLENSFTKKGNFRQFLKASLNIIPNGEFAVFIASGQESFKISPLASSNAFVVLAEEILECPAGSLIPVFPFSVRTGAAFMQPMKEPHACQAA